MKRPQRLLALLVALQANRQMTAEELAEQFSVSKRTILRDVDALAAGGNTIAVLASGIDRAYPVGHADLIDRVAHHGLLISEVPPGYAPTRQRFVDRSRIMAAVSGATVIVEAGARSGTLQTVSEANDLGRAVGAVPGPVTSAASSGTNLLLQTGRARVIMNATDVESILRGQADPAPSTSAPWAANRNLTHASALPSQSL